MTVSRAVIAVATGAWLGCAQVALGFALMQGAGATARLFYATIAVWIAGAAVGAAWSRAPAGARFLALCVVAVALFSSFVRRPWLAPFTLGGGLTIAAAVGVYAGGFIRHRSKMWGEVRPLLFHENNGFVLGYIAAGVLLLTYSDGLTYTVIGLGTVLCAVEWQSTRPQFSLHSRHRCM